MATHLFRFMPTGPASFTTLVDTLAAPVVLLTDAGGRRYRHCVDALVDHPVESVGRFDSCAAVSSVAAMSSRFKRGIPSSRYFLQPVNVVAVEQVAAFHFARAVSHEVIASAAVAFQARADSGPVTAPNQHRMP